VRCPILQSPRLQGLGHSVVREADLEEHSQRLSLGENHRRVVSAVLRRVETTCDEVIWWLERGDGELRHIEEDVSPNRAEALRTLVERLRTEMRRATNEIVIDPSVQSRARGIAASLSLTRTELEEVLTPGLRGYGAIPREAEQALDKKFARLLAVLRSMGEIAERSGSRGSKSTFLPRQKPWEAATGNPSRASCRHYSLLSATTWT
jgi:hypothetical protein